MYSLEDRMRAVQIYIESGCNEGAVIRELGYPSHTALRNWYKEDLRNGSFMLAVHLSPVIPSGKRPPLLRISRLIK